VPFKRQAAALLRVASEAVRRTGACNTVWGDAASPEGDNTDIAGVREAARAVMGALPVRRVMLIGTGGSARAAAVAVADEWPGVTVGIVSRDEERRREFVSWARQAGVGCGVWGVGVVQTPDLLINATPLGLTAQDPLPVRAETLAGTAGVLDLVYARGETALVRVARQAGARAADGRGVLVAQGAAAFARFFGVSAPTATMRAAVEDALRP
jgi:shikimate dehydrogenase